ncbi:unnamed protein product [Blumeria hordei]|uniref:Uncharacterized protein n=1 Tax=Blumeria hordei TaxID=2867405 RepID=A0A383UQQ8_BLUHO|nr:unnamed protein product [Blumeria hordei]
MAPKTYIVEHLDDELGSWSELEYVSIAKESKDAGDKFCLCSVPITLVVPESLKTVAGLSIDNRSVESIYAHDKERVCLLDPRAPNELTPADDKLFDVFLFGGILGDDPPRDRTSELRAKGFHGRRLGATQMTTDTAVRVTRLVIQKQKRLDEIPYNDEPEIQINKHESISMPFRYVQNAAGNPVMPDGMIDLIKKDSEKSFDDLF